MRREPASLRRMFAFRGQIVDRVRPTLGLIWIHARTDKQMTPHADFSFPSRKKMKPVNLTVNITFPVQAFSGVWGLVGMRPIDSQCRLWVSGASALVNISDRFFSVGTHTVRMRRSS